MTQLARVVWSEGMHLAQHHFQVQSRYFEDSVSFALSHLFFGAYGVVGCELDADALRNGTVSLIHGRGTMPDGTAFHFPDSDPVPEPREISDIFSPIQESHLVLLTIPPYRQGQSNCATEAGNGANVRYVPSANQVLDELTGQDEKTVTIGRKNFRLILDAEDHEDQVTLPLARVQRDGTGHFAYDPEYVPPCLQIGGSPRLLLMLSRLIDILRGKSESMADERKSAKKSLEDFAAGEVANFWLSHTIHSGLAPLQHHLHSKRTHPEQLYTDLARLAGALCTFSLDSHPRDLPPYDHDHLQECFDALDRHIRSNLEVLAPTNCLRMPLTPVRELLHTGQITDRRAFGKSQWILAVRSDFDGAQVSRDVPRVVKVCSAQHIARLVKEARPGLPLEHLPVPPSAVSPQGGTQYFGLTLKGPCWETTAETGEIGVFIPKPYSASQLELIVVLDS